MRTIGKLYSITNEKKNNIEIFNQFEDGTVQSYKKVKTGGEGTGIYSAFRHKNVPQFSTYAIAKSNKEDLLFCCNTGDNSVSSFKLLEDGELEFIDNVKTNNSLDQSLISLSYNDKKGVLYAHHFGGEHIHSFKVIEGKMEQFGDPVTLNNNEHPSRFSPSILVTPGNDYLLGHIVLDSTVNPNNPSESQSSKNNLCVFTLDNEGYPKSKKFFTMPSGTYASYFIDENTFIVTSSLTQEGIALATIDKQGEVSILDTVTIEKLHGKIKNPEACWQTYDYKTHTLYETNFGYGTITSAKIIDNKKLEILNDQELYIEGTGNVISTMGNKSSAPTDIVLLNRYVYVNWSGIGKMFCFSINDDGSLKKIQETDIIELGQYGLTEKSLI